MRSVAARDSLRASSASPLTEQTSDWEHQRCLEVGGRLEAAQSPQCGREAE